MWHPLTELFEQVQDPWQEVIGLDSFRLHGTATMAEAFEVEALAVADHGDRKVAEATICSDVVLVIPLHQICTEPSDALL